MLQIYKELDLEIPQDIDVKVDSRVITVKGPRGELTKVRVVDEELAISKGGADVMGIRRATMLGRGR